MAMDISPVAFRPVNVTGGKQVPGATSAAPATAPVVREQRAGVVKADMSIPAPEQLAQTVRQVNELFARRGQNLYASFEKDPATGISVVKVADRITHEVVRQMPPQVMVEFARALEQSQGLSGQLVSFKA